MRIPSGDDSLQRMPLSRRHAPDGLRLSRCAGWNQTLADWEMMLERGAGFGWISAEGVVVATAISLPLGRRVHWICMVLVDPEWRRRGLASTLMEGCLERAVQGGRAAWLDATADGEQVYSRLGFRTHAHFSRLRLECAPRLLAQAADGAGKTLEIQQMQAADLDRIVAWDRTVTGLSREFILKHQYTCWPEAGHLALDGEGRLCGYVLGRLGLNAREIGPLVAASGEVAERLYGEVLRCDQLPLYLDVADDQTAFVQRRLGEGWTVERGFARMVLGNSEEMKQSPQVYASSGPDWS